MFGRYINLVIGYFVYGAARQTSTRIHNLLIQINEPYEYFEFNEDVRGFNDGDMEYSTKETEDSRLSLR